MPIAVSIYPVQHRQDSTILPQITASGLTGAGYVKIAFEDSGIYYKVQSASPRPIQPPNKSLNPVPIALRQMLTSLGLWTRDTGINERSGDNGLERASGEGFNGAVFPTALDKDNCSVQATATSTNLSAGISLQNGSATIVHNYFHPNALHAINFGQNGRGAIFEAGVIPANNGSFRYAEGDTGLIEVKGGICRYYLVKSDGTYKLLRTTRSRLTENPKAEAILYFTGSALANVYLHSNNEATTSFENVCVIDYSESANFGWQAWRNPKTIATTADILEMADKTSRYTYPNQKRNLQSIALTPLSQEVEGYWKIVEVYNWHGQEREFIFVDRARKDVFGEPTEFWAKFATPIQDSTINGCRFDHAVSIQEDYRTDYIPRISDETPPTVTLDPITDNGTTITLSGSASDDILLKSLQIFINGAKHGSEFLPSGGSSGGTYSVIISKNSLAPGTNSIYVLAVDHAGNPAVSTTRTTIGGNFLTMVETVTVSDSINQTATVSRTEQVGIAEQIINQQQDKVDITDTVAITDSIIITPTPTTVQVQDTVSVSDSIVLDMGGEGEMWTWDEDNAWYWDEDNAWYW